MPTEYTITELKKYYEEFFPKDLDRYFEDGKLRRFGGSFPFVRTHKEWTLFVTLTACLYSIQVCLERNWNRDSSIQLMHDLGFNWMVFDADYGYLESFFERAYIKQMINRMCEIEDIRDVAPMVLRFIIASLEPFFNSYDSNGFKKDFFDKEAIMEYVRHYFFEMLRNLYRQYKPPTGLTGIAFDSKIYHSYYRQKFPGQLKQYFKTVENFDGFVEIQYINDTDSKRWDDGHPGDNATENIMFSITFMYMIMAEQIFLVDKNFQKKQFHKNSKWPFISSGPSAGPYLHPLRMLEIAGLAPTKSESSLYINFVQKIFPILRQDFFEILNNKMDNITDGHFKARIKKQLCREEVNIKHILEMWASSSENTLYNIIHKLGFPIMMKMPRP